MDISVFLLVRISLKGWVWCSAMNLLLIETIVIPVSFFIGITFSLMFYRNENGIFATIFMVIVSALAFRLVYPVRKQYKEIKDMKP